MYYDKRVIGMKLVPCSLTKEAENEVRENGNQVPCSLAKGVEGGN